MRGKKPPNDVARECDVGPETVPAGIPGRAMEACSGGANCSREGKE